MRSVLRPVSWNGNHVRICHFDITNFKGVRRAKVDRISDEPVVMISGANGTGKSLILRALNMAWHGKFPGPEGVGPWGDKTSIEIGISLTEEEFERTIQWATAHAMPLHDVERADCYSVRLQCRNGRTSWEVQNPVARTLMNEEFKQENPFAVMDFLPAIRLFPLASSPQVDLELLAPPRITQERREVTNNAHNSNGVATFGSISSYLATLDYRLMLTERQGLSGSQDYGLIANAFQRATGKTLLKPEIDPITGRSSIHIELPSGQRHGLEDLSSGEKEMLGVMYYIRRLSASGGVLFLDEPEQHLHPSLQAALFESMQMLADRAQVIAVSHSVKLISAVSQTALFQVDAPKEPVNQVVRLKDQPSRAALMAELGITPADLFQSDILLVVEGETDSKYLKALFPVELGRAHVIVAGNSKEVLAAHRTLAESPVGIPWICVMDRDLMSAEEATATLEKYPNLHVWPRRAIESMLLDPELISATTVGVGGSVDGKGASELLGRAVSGLDAEVLRERVEKALSVKFPAPDKPTDGDRYTRMEGYWRSYADNANRRADAVAGTRLAEAQALAATWEQTWVEQVDPKVALARLHGEIKLFANALAFKEALIARARADTSAMPAAFEEFRLKLVSLLQSNRHGNS
jgi:predicted ATPase